MNEGLSAVLPELRAGDADLEAGDALRNVTRGVQETGKPGKVVVTLTVKPNGGRSVQVETAVKSTVPEAKGASIFYADEQGNLSRRDPRQLTLDNLKEA